MEIETGVLSLAAPENITRPSDKIFIKIIFNREKEKNPRTT